MATRQNLVFAPCPTKLILLPGKRRNLGRRMVSSWWSMELRSVPLEAMYKLWEMRISIMAAQVFQSSQRSRSYHHNIQFALVSTQKKRVARFLPCWIWLSVQFKAIDCDLKGTDCLWTPKQLSVISIERGAIKPSQLWLDLSLYHSHVIDSAFRDESLPLKLVESSCFGSADRWDWTYRLDQFILIGDDT